MDAPLQSDLFQALSTVPVVSPSDDIIGFKSRKYKLGINVRGYRDLNSKDSQYFSIQAVFNVRKGGQKKVRQKGTRNVHAFVEGVLTGVSKQDISVLSDNWIEVTYNPFFTDTFIDKASGREVVSAADVILQRGSAWCREPEYVSL